MFYDSSLPTRRTLLVSGIAAFATTTFLGSGARALGVSVAEAAEDPPLIGADGPFQRSTVVEIARQLSKAAYAPPPSDLPDPIKNLTYDADTATSAPSRHAAIWAERRPALPAAALPPRLLLQGGDRRRASSMTARLITSPIRRTCSTPASSSRSRLPKRGHRLRRHSPARAHQQRRTASTRSPSSRARAISARSARIRSTASRRAGWR